MRDSRAGRHVCNSLCRDMQGPATSLCPVLPFLVVLLHLVATFFFVHPRPVWLYRSHSDLPQTVFPGNVCTGATRFLPL